jgi:hypothetical protein
MSAFSCAIVVDTIRAAGMEWQRLWVKNQNNVVGAKSML